MLSNASRKELVLVIVLLVILDLLFFWKLAINPGSMIYSEASDIVFYHYNIQKMKHDTLSNYSQLILWNPINNIGTSYIGDAETFMFYPPYALFYFFKPGFLFGFFIMLHAFLGGFFMYLFARKIGLGDFGAFVSAIIFMFSPKLMSHIFAGHYVFIGIAYTPLLLLLAELLIEEKKHIYGLLFSLFLGLQILCSHPQLVFYSSFIVLLYFVSRLIAAHKNDYTFIIKKCAWYGLYIILALLLSSAYLLPIIESTSLGTRPADFEFASSFSMPFRHLITMLLPNFYGTPLSHTYWGTENYWELFGFVGIIPLILALAGIFHKRNFYTTFFLALGVLLLLIALGKYTPLYYILVKAVPGFSLFRAPARILLFLPLCIGVLAGSGTKLFFSGEKPKIVKNIAMIALIISVISFASFFVSLEAKSSIISYGKNMVIEKYSKGMLPSEGPYSRTLEYYLDNVAIVFNQTASNLLFLVILCALTGVLIILKDRINPRYIMLIFIIIIVFDLWLYTMPLIEAKQTSDIYMANDIIKVLKNDNSRFRVLDMTNEFPSYIAAVHGIDFVDTGSNVITSDYAGYIEGLDDEKRALLNIKYFIKKKNNTFVIEENKGFLPRAFVTKGLDDVKMVSGAETAYYSPNKIIIKADVKEHSYLFLSEMFYPGWKAYDNKKEVKIEKSGIFRAIKLDEGIHNIEFTYKPKNLVAGIIISAISFAAIIIMIITIIIRRKK